MKRWYCSLICFSVGLVSQCCASDLAGSPRHLDIGTVSHAKQHLLPRGLGNVTKRIRSRDGGPSINPDALVATQYLAHPEYRPWGRRFRVRQNDDSMLYHRYAANHVGHPMTPNSVDRSAQSAVLLGFAAAVFFLLLAWLATSWIYSDHFEWVQLLAFTGFGAAPLLLLAQVSLLVVFFQNFSRPTRSEFPQDSWECSGLLYFVLIYPILTTMLIVMAGMTYLSHVLEGWSVTASETDGKSVHSEASPWLRVIPTLTLYTPPFWLTAVCATIDMLLCLAGALITFGSESHRCIAELWWSSALLSSTALLVAGASALLAVLAFVAMLVARSSWLQDFVASCVGLAQPAAVV